MGKCVFSHTSESVDSITKMGLLALRLIYAFISMECVKSSDRSFVIDVDEYSFDTAILGTDYWGLNLTDFVDPENCKRLSTSDRNDFLRSQELSKELDRIGRSCCSSREACQTKATCFGVDQHQNPVNFVNVDICTRNSKEREHRLFKCKGLVRKGRVGLEELVQISQQHRSDEFSDDFCFDQVCASDQQEPQYHYQQCTSRMFLLNFYNVDCPRGESCGELHLEIDSSRERKNSEWDENIESMEWREKIITKTSPVLNLKHVISIRVYGQGCFVLYENQHFEKPSMIKVYQGFKLKTKIPKIGSVEYWHDCKGSFEDKNRIRFLELQGALIKNVTENVTM